MKLWFKHKHGYLNIDDDYLYVNKSGNWSGVHELPERNTNQHLNRKSNEYILTVALVVILLTSYDVNASPNIINITFLSIAVIVPSIYFTKAIRSPNFDLEFKIDRAKINRIEIQGNAVKIEFLDIEEHPVFHTFKEIDAKGLEIMKELSSTYTR